MDFKVILTEENLKVTACEIEGSGCIIHTIYKDTISSLFVPNVKIVDGKVISASPVEPLFDMLSQLKEIMETKDDEIKH